jgi:hypothetical protein
MKISEALEIIEAAIEGFEGDTGPGHWKAKVWSTGYGRRPALVYEYIEPDPKEWEDEEEEEDEGENIWKDPGPPWHPMPGPEWEDADDPWKRWGGDQIVETIEATGKLRCTDGMLDYWKIKRLYQDAGIFSAVDDEFEEEEDDE